jgi:CRISPR/Cas system-associated exonuclease Cas4 (RecB family)
VTDALDIPDYLRRTKDNQMTATFPQPLIFTYTMINTYDICPHQMYRRYVKKDLKFVETPEMRFGNEVHSAFEYRMGGKPLPLNMQIWEPIASAIADRKPRTEQQLAIDDNGKPAEYEGKGTAKPFFRGKNDLTLLNGTKALLLDIKTGKKREDPNELETNAMLIHAHNPHLTEIKGAYVWLKEGTIGQTHELSDTQSTWARVNNKAEEIEDCMATNQWAKKKGPLCGYCNVIDCENRVGAKAGK